MTKDSAIHLDKVENVEPDLVSDPALSDAQGHDWTDEGGATPTGPATKDSPEN